MSTFSTNQVRNLFVINSYSATSLNDGSAVGTIAVKDINDSIYFEYKTPDGVLRSDFINKDKLLYANAISGAKLAGKLKKYKVELTKDPISGKSYVMEINIRGYGSLSPENTYQKFAAVYSSSTDRSEFYQKLFDSLVLNFKKESIKMFEFTKIGSIGGITLETSINYMFKVEAAASVAKVDLVDKLVTITPKTSGNINDINTAIASSSILGLKALAIGTLSVSPASNLLINSIAIEEVEQPWTLGIKESEPLEFDILCKPININDLGEPWGIATKIASTSIITNGKIAADMEYFYMGERGDVYRNMGFPFVYNTKYLTNSDKSYAMIDLAFYHNDEGTNITHSDKAITLSVINDSNTIANNLISAINIGLGQKAGTSFYITPLS